MFAKYARIPRTDEMFGGFLLVLAIVWSGVTLLLKQAHPGGLNSPVVQIMDIAELDRVTIVGHHG
jgi:hypothetical protein